MRDAAGELPDRLHLLDVSELFARAFERDFGLPARGDILADSVQPHHPAGIVLDDFDGVLQIPDLAIRPHDPPLAAEALPGLDRARELLARAIAVVRMNELEKRVERAAVLAGLPSVDVAELVRPDGLVVLDVSHPTPQLGEPLRLLKMDTLFDQLGLGVLATIDLLPQGEVGGRERCGAPIDALVEIVLRAAQFLLGPLAHRHVGAQRQAGNGDADHEHQQQQKGFVEIWLRERAGAGERVPDREAGKYQRDGRSVALAAAQRRPHQRHDGEKAERRLVGLLDQRTERNEADSAGAGEDGNRFGEFPAPQRLRA